MLRFFFDRNIGKSIPQALLRLDLRKHEIEVTYHCQPRREIEYGGGDEPLFEKNTSDEEIFRYCGDRRVLISQDYKWQYEPVHQLLIAQYKVRVFFLWGASEKMWHQFRVFSAAFDSIVEMATNEPGPYIRSIGKDGRITQPKLHDGKPKSNIADNG